MITAFLPHGHSGLLQRIKTPPDCMIATTTGTRAAELGEAEFMYQRLTELYERRNWVWRA
jgi:hypothetical protein